MKKLFCLIAALLCGASASMAQSIGTGAYAFASFDNPGFDSINLGNLNLRFNVPIVNRPGRGMAFNYSIQYEGMIWQAVPSGGATVWVPDPNWGFSGLLNGVTFSGYLTHATQSNSNCPKPVDWPSNHTFPPGQRFTNFTYHDAYGANHRFNYTSYNCPLSDTNPSPTGDGTASDGSGYSLVNETRVRTRNGAIITPAKSPTGSDNTSITDANGNMITSSGGSSFTDTLGVTALTISGSSPRVFTYPVTLQSDAATSASTSISYHTYTIRTNFQCPGITEYGSTTADLIDRITYADGSYYAFTYEGTPGATDGAVTARIGSITLPTGGTISYSYTAGCGAGITPSGTVGNLWRTTADGLRVYGTAGINSNATQTNLQDEKGNQTAFAFTIDADSGRYYETHRTVYQGPISGGVVLQDQYTCYNGATDNCDGQLMALPINQIGITNSFNNGTQSYTINSYSDGLLTSSAQKSGATTLTSTSNTYNSFGELISSTTTDGAANTISSVSYGYDETAPTLTSGIVQHATVSGPAGNPTSAHTWTAGGTLTSTTSYYDTGAPLAVTAPDGGQTQYGYDATQAFVTSATLPASLATAAGYDTASAVQISATGLNPGETTTVNQFDRLLRPTNTSLPSGSTITATYSPTQTSVSQTQSAGVLRTTVTQADAYGRTSRVAVYNGQLPGNDWYQTDYCYDPSGLLQFQSAAYQSSGFSAPKRCSGSGVSYEYDTLGRTTKVTTDDGPATTTYQNRAIKTTDVNNVQRITQYDLLGRISAVCEISSSTLNGQAPTACGMDIPGTGFLTTYAYDLANHQTTISQGGQTRVFRTDAAGRTVYTSEPERGVTTYSYSYNSTGLLVTRIRPRANQTGSATTTTLTQYDQNNRPVTISYDDGTPTKQFQYDQSTSMPGSGFPFGNGKGRLTMATTSTPSAWSMTLMAYDVQGNPVTTLQCFPGECGNPAFDVWRYYQYDLAGDRTQESFFDLGCICGNRVDTNTSYDNAGGVIGMSNNMTDPLHNNGALLSNVQNSASGPSTYTLGNGLSGAQFYDTMGRNWGKFVCSGSTSISCAGGGQSYGTESSFSGSRVVGISDTVLNTGGNFTYDEFDRLTGANFPGAGRAYTYSYDRWGNRLAQTQTPGTNPAPFSFTANRIDGYSYDAAGNLLSDNVSNSYTYDAEGNVITTNSGGQISTFAYDAFNHRVKVTTSTSDTDYGFNVAGQRVSSWDTATPGPYLHLLSAYNYWSGRPIAVYTNARTYYVHQDLLGTTRLTTASDGSTVGTYTSLPFGDSLNASGTDPEPAHFALLDHDYESNTDHAQFRQYSPSQGRWMSPDPYDGSYNATNPQSFNRYSYAMNTPMTGTDPSGLDKSGTANYYGTFDSYTLDGMDVSASEAYAALAGGSALMCPGSCAALSFSYSGTVSNGSYSLAATAAGWIWTNNKNGQVVYNPGEIGLSIPQDGEQFSIISSPGNMSDIGGSSNGQEPPPPCQAKILNATNNQFGTKYTDANVNSTFNYSTGAGPGQGTLNLNINGSTAGVSPGYYPVHWWTYVIGYGPTLHVVSGPGGNGGLDSQMTLPFGPNQGTFHIDSGYPHNPFGAVFHGLLNMTKLGGYPQC